MTAEVITAIGVLAYLSLVLELTVLHVPSVASSRNIWLASPAVAATYSSSWRHVFHLSHARKVVFFVLPVAVVWCVYLYPLVATVRGDFLGDHLFGPTRATNAVAALFIVVGRGLTLGSMRVLHRPSPATGGLTTRGLFRYSRNPGLVGMYAFATGLWLVTPSLTMLCGIVVYVVYMHVKVRMEEDHLEHTVGDAYRAYRRSTNRYLP